MSGNYAEIVELRGSILRAIMKKNRGELTREIKRGERLKNNGALGLLLNVARLTLDMFQERNRMKKRLLDLTETIEKADKVNEDHVNEIIEINNNEVNECKEEISRLQKKVKAQKSDLKKMKKSIERQNEAASATNNTWNKIRAMDLEADGDPRVLSRKLVLLEEKFQNELAEVKHSLAIERAARLRAEKGMFMVQKYSANLVPDMYATDDTVREKVQKIDKERQVAVGNAQKYRNMSNKWEEENNKLRGMVDFLKEKLRSKSQDFCLVKQEVHALFAERKNFNATVDREIEKEKLRQMVHSSRLQAQLDAEVEWRLRTTKQDISYLHNKIEQLGVGKSVSAQEAKSPPAEVLVSVHSKTTHKSALGKKTKKA